MDVNLYAEFYNLVKQIPRGRVTTYGDLAIALGDIIASRAVGKMLSENPVPGTVPCHRVVMGDGTIGGFTHPEGVEKKIHMLMEEGVEIFNGKIVNFETLRYREFNTWYPLKKIREEEEVLKKNISLRDREFEKIIVTDVSYAGRNAFISFVELDRNFSIVNNYVRKTRVNFPYIPTYLSYREGNAIISVMEEEGLYILDGQGILHPRGIGLATYFGVVKGLPSIGIAKSRLIGDEEGDRIFLNGKQVGWKIGKYYISPGNFISLKKSLKVANGLIKSGAISIAHKLATVSRNEYCRSNNCGPFS